MTPPQPPPEDPRALERRYNLLFEQVPCCVAVIDRDLRVVRANELARRTFGDHVGEHCYRMYKGRDHRCDDCPALRTFVDVTETDRLTRKLIEEERLAAVGQTVAQLAHGIKNVLTGLQGGMYALKTGMRRGSSERTARGWTALERNVERLTDLVKGFLGFAKGHEPQARPTDPGAVAEEVVSLYRASAERSGVALALEVQPDLRPASLDPEGLRTCLENLVSNAIDACQVADNEGSVALRVREETGVLVYEVADTGCGMDYEIKSKVFTTFFSTKGTGGTGLGLLVTRKIVQEHGGRIEVESVPGEGSVFRIGLPRDRLPAPRAAEGQ